MNSYEGHSGIVVKMIEDSIRFDCQERWRSGCIQCLGRINTLELTYPRWIHAEFMTHRDRARNAASSRAVSIKKSFENTKFRPYKLQSEKKGMQGGDEIGVLDRDLTYRDMDELCRITLEYAQKWADRGVHKGIINRYLEPWAHITVVCTTTQWWNFLRQRYHPAAEQHFQELARLIKKCLEQSKPKVTDFHLPYVAEDERSRFIREQLKRISASRSAAVSYKRPDYTAEREFIKGQELIDAEPAHASPLEHPATCFNVELDKVFGPHRAWRSLRNEVGHDNQWLNDLYDWNPIEFKPL